MSAITDTIRIADGSGGVISESHDVLALLEYARATPVDSCVLIKHPNRTGTLLVLFSNRASCVVNFASSEVMSGWVAAQHWGGRCTRIGG